MNKYDFVRYDEELYRHISYNHKEKTKISSQAFFDPKREPSVDRAKFKDFEPALSKRRDRDTDGIVSLLVSEVRGIQIDNHIVDVIYDPLPENPEHSLPENRAHSLIILTPKCDLSKSKRKQAFSTLRRTLALHSTVKIEPQEIRGTPKK